jgi:hypothetical protein
MGSIGSAAILSVVFHNRVSDHGLHTVAAIMIGASIVVLLFTLADRSLRKPIGSETPTRRIRPSSQMQETRAQ